MDLYPMLECITNPQSTPESVKAANTVLMGVMESTESLSVFLEMCVQADKKESIRTLCLTCAKTMIESKWRAFNPELKTHVLKCSMHAFQCSEGHPLKIAAALVGKVARNTLTMAGSSCIDICTSLNAVDAQGNVSWRNTLGSYCVLKEFSCITLPIALNKASTVTVHFKWMNKLWEGLSQQLCEGRFDMGPKWLLATKAVQILTTKFKQLEPGINYSGILQIILQKAFEQSAPEMEEMWGKVVRRIFKWAQSWLSQKVIQPGASTPDLLGMNVVATILNTYTGSEKNHVYAMTRREYILLIELLSHVNFAVNPEVYRDLCSVLLKLLRLTEGELALWQSDPEKYMDDNVASNDDEYSIGDAREKVAHILAAMLNEGGDWKPTEQHKRLVFEFLYPHWHNPSADVLNCDAALQWLGHSWFSFPPLFSSGAFQELMEVLRTIMGIDCVVLQRRAVWFIGQWTAAWTDEQRSNIYGMLTEFLQAKYNFAIRLTAVQTLSFLIDSESFRVELFGPHIAAVFAQIVSLLKGARQSNAHITLLTSLNFLVKELKQACLPYCEAIISELGSIRELATQALEADDIRIFNKLIRLLCSLTAVMDPSAPVFHHYIKLIFIEGQAGKAALLTPLGMELLYNVLRNATTPIEGFLDYFDFVVGMAEIDSEVMVFVLKVLQRFSTIGGIEFVRARGESLDRFLRHMLTTSSEPFARAVTRVAEVVMRVGPEAVQSIPQTLRAGISVILSEKQECEDDGPMPLLLRDCVAMTSRAILMNFPFATSLLAEAGLPEVMGRWLEVDLATPYQINISKQACAMLAASREVQMSDEVRSYLSIHGQGITECGDMELEIDYDLLSGLSSASYL